MKAETSVKASDIMLITGSCILSASLYMNNTLVNIALGFVMGILSVRLWNAYKSR